MFVCFLLFVIVVVVCFARHGWIASTTCIDPDVEDWAAEPPGPQEVTNSSDRVVPSFMGFWLTPNPHTEKNQNRGEDVGVLAHP